MLHLDALSNQIWDNCIKNATKQESRQIYVPGKLAVDGYVLDLHGPIIGLDSFKQTF